MTFWEPRPKMTFGGKENDTVEEKKTKINLTFELFQSCTSCSEKYLECVFIKIHMSMYMHPHACVAHGRKILILEEFMETNMF